MEAAATFTLSCACYNIPANRVKSAAIASDGELSSTEASIFHRLGTVVEIRPNAPGIATKVRVLERMLSLQSWKVRYVPESLLFWTSSFPSLLARPSASGMGPGYAVRRQEHGNTIEIAQNFPPETHQPRFRKQFILRGDSVGFRVLRPLQRCRCTSLRFVARRNRPGLCSATWTRMRVRLYWNDAYLPSKAYSG